MKKRKNEDDARCTKHLASFTITSTPSLTGEGRGGASERYFLGRHFSILHDGAHDADAFFGGCYALA